MHRKNNNGPIYLKVVLGDWRAASRDKRELRLARSMGYNVKIIATTKDTNKIYLDSVDGFEVIRIPTRLFGDGRILSFLGKLIAVLLYINQIKKIDAYIISGHNLDGWLVGYIAKRKKSRYIYDSHEFELYRVKRKNCFSFQIVKMIERFALNHSKINMMVSDGIADEIQRIYKLKERPLVVRNVPEKSNSNFPNKDKNRIEFIEHLNVSEDAFIIMHHGGFAVGRGAEEAIKATARLENVGLVLMGYSLSDDYMKSLIKLTKDLNCKDRVYFKKAVPFSELYDNIAASDLGIVLTQNICECFYYSLPNKLMENIQAETPVVGSNFPDISKIINGYKIGKTIEPDNIDALVNTIRGFRDNQEKYKWYKDNLKVAKEDLCWEKECLILSKELEKIS